MFSLIQEVFVLVFFFFPSMTWRSVYGKPLGMASNSELSALMWLLDSDLT